MHSRLPVLLEHVGRWLDDPARALGALDYTILPCTADGRRLLQQIQSRTVDERARVFAGFSADELAGLVAALDRIDANLRELL